MAPGSPDRYEVVEMTASDPAAIAGVFIATGMLACVAIIGIYLRYRTNGWNDTRYDRTASHAEWEAGAMKVDCPLKEN